MLIPGYNVPLLGTPTFGKVSLGTPARDPTVGVFIKDQGLLDAMFDGGTHYRNTHGISHSEQRSAAVCMSGSGRSEMWQGGVRHRPSG